MKKIFAGLTAAVLVWSPARAADLNWDNWAQISAPSTNYPYAPQIDAIHFFNHRGATFDVVGTSVYTTSDTATYTNQGSMTGYPGFDFQTYPPAEGIPHMADTFANIAGGTGNGVINCFGTIFFGGVQGIFFGSLAGNSRITVNAANIINSGNINMSASSLLSLRGKNIDLSRGGLNMDNTTGTQIFGTNAIIFGGLNLLFNAGILDDYWVADTATNAFNPAQFQANFPFTPMHIVTNRDYLFQFEQLIGQVAYVNDSGVIGSNRFVQAAFLYNPRPEFDNSVYFSPQEIAVQWQWVTKGWPDTTTLTTNYMFVTDNFGEVTNIGVRVNGYINPQAYAPRPTYCPINYQFFQGLPYSAFNNVPAATPGMLPNVFPNLQVTNQFAAYEALFTAGTALPSDIAGGAYSNMPGRIEISAETSLNLNRARISTLNYLRLEATNHFRGSQNAVITTPYADYYLRATNGLLTISNVIAPYIAHPHGPCQLYSARWTNVINSITNAFHVLFVNSYLDPLTIPKIANLHLAVTNVPGSAPKNLVINDVLHVTTSLELKAERLTIGQNDPLSFNPTGQLNVETGDVIWPTATPGLLYLTNWGSIGMLNAVYFGGSRTQPPYNNTPDIPYETFVNHGTITNQGSIIWSKYFENNGLIDAGFGSILLQNGLQAVMNEGGLNAPFGQVTLSASSLTASNSMITAGGPLELSATNSISDGGGLFSANSWSAGSGFSLLNKPAVGDLLATTVFNSAAAYEETLNYWAGEDRGATVAGFSNNVALGRLVLNGSTGSGFRFIATGPANALYVDLLDLRGSVTNRDVYGNYPGLNIDPNMKIYFADATINGQSIAEKLNGRNAGHLVWVSSYAGNYSSTNLLYPDGKIYSFNRALVQSCNLDSDNDGVANCSDPTPIFVPGIVQLSIAITNRPAGARLLTWPTLANSTNTVEYKTSPTGSNWQIMTNFVVGPNTGRAAVVDTTASSTRYYRVRVNAAKP